MNLTKSCIVLETMVLSVIDRSAKTQQELQDMLLGNKEIV
jgi:hypothetical protein